MIYILIHHEWYIDTSVAESYLQASYVPLSSSPVLLRKVPLSHNRRKVVTMTITTFVPMSDTESQRPSRQALEKHLDPGVQVDSGKGGSFFCLKGPHPETMPKPLRDVPMASIQMVKEGISPITAVANGRYADGDITARVNTYVQNDVAYQTIKVIGTNGTTVEALNLWFDDLIAGKKADKNLTMQRAAAS